MNEAASTTLAKTGLSPALRRALWACAAATLLFPAIAMQFTNQVNWALGDFMVFGGMLLILIGGIEAAVKYPSERKWRIAAVGASLLIFLLVLIELAVGLFD